MAVLLIPAVSLPTSVLGLSNASVFEKMPETRKQELVDVLVAHLKQSLQQFDQPACRVNIQTDADWLTANLGRFSSSVSFSQLTQFNISGVAVLDYLTGEQKAQLILQPGSGALVNESVVREVFSSVVQSSDQKQLENFLIAFSQSTVQMNGTSIPPAVSDTILNMTLEALAPRFQTFSTQDFTLWFQTYLRLFLPAIGPSSLSVIPRNVSCDSYREIVKGLDGVYRDLSATQSQNVFSYTLGYLTSQSSQGQSCVQSVRNDSDWLLKNFGQFRNLASLSEIIALKSDFNGVSAATDLTSSQLAELCSVPSRLHGPQDVNTVMAAISPDQFASFFDIITPNILVNASLYSSEVKGAFLQAVLVRGGLSSAAVPDSEVEQWLNVRLEPLLSSLSSADVAPFFNITRGRSCSTSQAALIYILFCNRVRRLDSLRSSFSSATQTLIYTHIQQLLAGPNVLQCYGGGSFYVFLRNSFLGFGFPDLSTFLSLVPASRQREVVLTLRGSDSDSETVDTSLSNTLLGSISTGELREYLNGSTTVGSDLCRLLTNYNRTTQYLETEPVVSAAVGRQTLECVWSRALAASSPVEVDQWFKVTLAQYLPFLSSKVINPTQLSGASCLSYRRLVSVLGKNYDYSGADFTPADVYSSIRAYLNSSDGAPRCYNSSDPLLNSTAWFSNNIGTFVTFITLTDLQSFVSDGQIGVFLDNSENLQLFNNSGIPANVTTYYSTQLYIQNPNFNPLRYLTTPHTKHYTTQLYIQNPNFNPLRYHTTPHTKHYTTQLYIQNPNFNPLRLPGVLLCGTPGTAFVSFGATDSQDILEIIKKNCQQIPLEVTAALVANLPTISTSTIQLLGNQSVGLTEGQISTAPPKVISSNLPTLSSVTGWNQGQVNIIIQSITDAGFTINSGSALVTLGTLIGGVPSAVISNIPSTELLAVSQNPTFITNILSAPVVLQQTYVQKIVSVDVARVVENVPDALAKYIPPVILSSPTSVNVSLINKKSWKQEQAVVLFSSVASASDNTEELSESILQGFTCSSAEKLQQKVTQLVKACRPRPGRSKVFLKESQLTCMYNYVKDDPSLSFTDLPSDMLLYYSYEKVKVSCRSYFSALGGADFSVLSSVLNRQSILFKNARACLGITGVGLTRDQVEVLGNMACTLDPTSIQNSDPLILEKLKNCGDLSDSQVTAVQTLLYSGSTPYGKPSSWSVDTLNQLGMLPLYLKQDFWTNFDSGTKRTFLRFFNPLIRKQKIQISKIRRFFTESSVNIKLGGRAKSACTAGNITEATIADPSFPFGYDSAQFDSCLDSTLLKDNLAAVTEKVVDTSFLAVILSKLNQDMIVESRNARIEYPGIFVESRRRTANLPTQSRSSDARPLPHALTLPYPRPLNSDGPRVWDGLLLLYPSGLPESVVRLLGPTSRMATVEDISKWNLTTVDTLSSLMGSVNGDWTPEQSKAVIMKYLGVPGNTLGTSELNEIGSSVCSLDVSVLRAVTAASLSVPAVLRMIHHYVVVLWGSCGGPDHWRTV
ncbi:hypothetical protein NFI96_032612 [Prochilodus magdalenae]|nr:hypothetical protein NFI96_032612 [Prochilodus magdalenae]